jgi:ABC-type glycerol-3-phosphate transport system permease component
MIMAVIVSFKSPSEVIQSPLSLPHHLRWENYVSAFRQMNFLKGVLNTVLITAGSSLLLIPVAAIAAYPLARLQGRYMIWISNFFLMGLSIPGFVLLIPLFNLMKSLHLMNTHLG